MGDVKTPDQMAEHEVNKKLAKAIAKRQLKIKEHQAKIKKLEKEITKIKSGELVPSEGDSSSDSTYINFILDESGSMEGSTAVKDFNEYLQTMKKEKGDIFLTLTKFNSDRVNIVYNEKSIKEIKEMKNSGFSPSGLTPLYDSIGKTVNSVKGKGKILYIILTDGMENFSKEYSEGNIKDLIKKKEKEGCVFTYLGVKEDAWGGGASLGIAQCNTLNVRAGGQSRGTATFASASRSFHRTGQFKLKR